MSDDVFKIFTDDISDPFTTMKCPKCGYRGQITSEWSTLAGEMIAGSCGWCTHQSPKSSKNRAEPDFLMETWRPETK